MLGLRHHAGCRVVSDLRMRFEERPGGAYGLKKMCPYAGLKCRPQKCSHRSRNCIFDPMTGKRICP